MVKQIHKWPNFKGFQIGGPSGPKILKSLSLLPTLSVPSLNLPSSFSTSIQFEHKQDHKEPQNHRPQSMSKPTVLASIGLGGGAAVITCNFTHPIELVKTRMQSKYSPRRSNLNYLLSTMNYH